MITLELRKSYTELLIYIYIHTGYNQDERYISYFVIYKGEDIMERVNQRGKYLFIAGIISLIIAIVILFVIPDPSANNVEIAKKATSAMQAAQEISKNNQSSILMHTIGMGLLGFGITGTVGGFILKSFKKKQ